MPKNIKDIKVLGEKDKLIILVADHPESHLIHMTDVVSEFMKKNDGFLFIKGLQVFILKDGAEVILAQVLNDEIEKGGG